MSDSNDVSKDIGVTSSPALDEYHRGTLERVRQQLPLLAARLKSIGVASVEVQYDGRSDSGQIEDIICRDANGDRVKLTGKTPVTDDQLSDIFYDLIEVRHAGWENNDRFTDYHTTEHEGV